QPGAFAYSDNRVFSETTVSFLRRSRRAVGSFPGLSRNEAVRLKTSRSGRESSSWLKKPWRSNCNAPPWGSGAGWGLEEGPRSGWGGSGGGGGGGVGGARVLAGEGRA